MLNKSTKQQKEKSNPFLWFIFAIVVPIIVATTLAIIIFSIAGVDVLDWAKKTGNSIPVISSMVTTDEEKNTQQTEEKLMSSIERKDAKIDQLTQDVSDLETTIDQLEQEVLKLENEKTPDSSVEEETNNSTQDNPVKTISSSYEEMDSEQAAKILQNLDSNLAISILKEISNDTRGAIFDEMDPEKAAALTQLFVESGGE